MTTVIIANIVFACFVLVAIVGGLVWTILTDHPHHLGARRPELHGHARALVMPMPEPARG